MKEGSAAVQEQGKCQGCQGCSACTRFELAVACTEAVCSYAVALEVVKPVTKRRGWGVR